MDDRVMRLIADRTVHCTLRKQNQSITWWWRERLDDYSRLFARSDAGEPHVVALLDRLFVLIKFVALPNGDARKQELIAKDWPALEADLRGLP